MRAFLQCLSALEDEQAGWMEPHDELRLRERPRPSVRMLQVGARMTHRPGLVTAPAKEAVRRAAAVGKRFCRSLCPGSSLCLGRWKVHLHAAGSAAPGAVIPVPVLAMTPHSWQT